MATSTRSTTLTSNKLDDTMATSSEDKVDALNIYIFNNDNIPAVPGHESRETLSDVNITPNIIKKKLE